MKRILLAGVVPILSNSVSKDDNNRHFTHATAQKYVGEGLDLSRLQDPFGTND